MNSMEHMERFLQHLPNNRFLMNSKKYGDMDLRSMLADVYLFIAFLCFPVQMKVEGKNATTTISIMTLSILRHSKVTFSIMMLSMTIWKQHRLQKLVTANASNS
jgi:hypothetical protein